MISSPAKSRFPGLSLKAWVFFTAGGTLIAGGNITSVVRSGVGTYNITFTNSLGSANFVGDCTPVLGGISQPQIALCTPSGATTATIYTQQNATLLDMGCHAAFYG